MDTTKSEKTKLFPPVISVLGHVDHGKTTLLDALRTTDVAGGEKGGITQRIGASEIDVPHEGSTRRLTLIDTPGHEAFANMRGYGVSAADIALLIVATDDGVMPQTKESIKLLQESQLPFIVVFTKKDVPGAILEKVKQQVIRENVLLEGLGGDIPYIAVSATKGEGIKELIDLILLYSEVKEIKKDDTLPMTGVVIESKLDKKRGAVATIIVKQGRLSLGATLFQGEEVGKARALVNSHGASVKEAVPGDAVEILGIKKVLQTGSLVYTASSDVVTISEKRVTHAAPHSLATFFEDEKVASLKIILKTEGKGELDAIKNSLPEDVKVVYEGQGDISFSDVLMAKDFKAIIMGFNVKIDKEAKRVAETEGIFYRIYSIIYELLDEVKEALEGMIVLEAEKTLGLATVLAKFPSDNRTIIGIRVDSGRIAINDNIKLLRNDKEQGSAKIASIKRGKQDVKEVAKNLECGIIVEPELDFQIGDVVKSYRM